jgi:zinc transporter ZupT
MIFQASVPFLILLACDLQFFAGALLFSAIADIFPEPECSPPDENDKQV